METLIEILVGFLGAAAAIFLFRLLKPSPSDNNSKVMVEVKQLEKENSELEQKARNTLQEALDRINDLEEKKREKIKTQQELADFFNNRKPD